MEGFGSVQIIKDPIHEAQKHLDPTATDPDHGSGRLGEASLAEAGGGPGAASRPRSPGSADPRSRLPEEREHIFFTVYTIIPCLSSLYIFLFS